MHICYGSVLQARNSWQDAGGRRGKRGSLFYSRTNVFQLVFRASADNLARGLDYAVDVACTYVRLLCLTKNAHAQPCE